MQLYIYTNKRDYIHSFAAQAFISIIHDLFCIENGLKFMFMKSTEPGQESTKPAWGMNGPNLGIKCNYDHKTPGDDFPQDIESLSHELHFKDCGILAMSNQQIGSSYI